MCHLFTSEICSVDDYCNVLITYGLHKITVVIMIIVTYLHQGRPVSISQQVNCQL